MSGAVIDHASFCGKRYLSLLLMFRLFYKTAVAKDLQENKAPADRYTPEQKKAAEEIESAILAEAGVTGHDYSKDLSFRRCAKRRGGTCSVLAPANSRFLVAFAPSE
ncbi:MAG: hypothetical protein WBV69_16385 [Candidatus Sulfotelmatobacter sp.]